MKVAPNNEAIHRIGDQATRLIVRSARDEDLSPSDVICAALDTASRVIAATMAAVYGPGSIGTPASDELLTSLCENLKGRVAHHASTMREAQH